MEHDSPSSPKELAKKSSFESLHFSDSQQSEGEYEIPDLTKTKSKIAATVKTAYKNGRSKVQAMTTNLLYSLKNSEFKILSKRQKVVLNHQVPVVLLGQKYQNFGEEKEQFYEDFMKVIWLSYRNRIGEIESDAGWGCMIRVCQMVIAESFKRLFSGDEFRLENVVKHFKDTPEAILSLTRICEKGHIKERWTSSIEIFSIIRELLEEIKGNKMGRLKLPSIEVHSGFIEIKNLEKYLNKTEYPALIFVSNRLSSGKIEKDFERNILALMEVQSFVGGIGGEGGEALFLIGHYDSKAIFLDPHYVQSAEKEQASTYFQSDPYCISIDQLAGSVAFNFLVCSKQEHEALLVELYELQLLHEPDVCIQVLSEELRARLRGRKESDDFELLA